MSEAEIWELLNDYNTSGLNGMALYLTITSSYLIAAFLIGEKLTRYQVAVISGLFVIFALLFTYGVVGFFDRANYFATLMSQYTDSPFRQRPIMPLVIGVMQCIGVVACLKFMWDVRHPKSE